MVRAKASTIWYVDTPDPAAVLGAGAQPDHDAALALAGQLHPDSEILPIETGTLALKAGPGMDTVFIGCYPGITVVCGPQFALPRPSKLAEEFIRPLASEHTYLTAADPRLGWGGFAYWERGMLRRSFSATQVNILENEGLPLVWERPFWAGSYPMPNAAGGMPEPQRLPFDPLTFADEANNQWLGFRYADTDRPPPPAPDPADIPVCGFALYPLGEAPTTSTHSTPRNADTGHPVRKWLRRRTHEQSVRHW